MAQESPNLTSENSVRSGSLPAINRSAFWRALIAPLLVWLCMAAPAILSGQPGVVCVTPLAWGLATWGGLRYISLAGGSPGRHPLLGAALLGVLLGVFEGIFFIVVLTFASPPATADDANKALILDLVVFVTGMLICAGLSVFTALLAMKRIAREPRG